MNNPLNSEPLLFELRTDPIVGRRVLLAEHRAGRPNDFVAHPPDGSDASADCPFCAGHESQTVASVWEAPGKDGKWQARVIPNKYPAVAPGSLEPLSACGAVPEGAHEVVIESPQHIQDMTDLSVADLALVLRAYRDRIQFWSGQAGLQHVTLFKNVGLAAGASLEHIHSQIVVLPEPPPAVAQELRAGQQHYAAHQRCLFCDLLAQELDEGQRLVQATDRFVAFCAVAGRQPYETWILPRAHQAGFQALSDSDALALAELLLALVGRLRDLLPPLAYNLILHSAPFDLAEPCSYHWHFELVPRSTQLAGFEWATGMHINPLAPERAAARLRRTPC